MRTTKTLAGILSGRLDQPEAFEVFAGMIGDRYFQQALKAVHQDCFEYADGTYVMFENLTDLRIIER